MKKSIILVSCMFLTTCMFPNSDETQTDESWGLISINNIEQYVDKIFFVTEDNGWIIGNDGTILASNDGGYRWNFQNSNTKNDLTGIFFIDQYNGWITGLKNTFLHTTDAGKNWQQVNVYNDTSKHNTDVYFADHANGWLLNNYGEIFKTNDGGESWNSLNTLPNLGWSEIKFFDRSTGYAVQLSGDKLMKTSNGGESWHEIKLFIPDAKLGIMLRDIYFIDPNIGFYSYSWRSGGIMERASPIMKTSDGGYSWVFQDSIMNRYLKTLYFLDEENGMFAGSNLIYSTANSGKQWNTCVILNKNEFITDIFYYEKHDGWALSHNGNVYKNIR